MKKFYIISAIVVISLVSCFTSLTAQNKAGIIAGANFSSIGGQVKREVAQFHAGLTYQVKFPLGFAIQPSFIYSQKGAKIENAGGDGNDASDVENGASKLKVGYLEVPVSIQWGPDLLLFRPFLDVTPFIGYGIHNKTEGDKISFKFDEMNRFEYGIGVGVGLEIWKFQLIARYNWNLGSLKKSDNDDQLLEKLGRGNFKGFTLSAAILF